MEYSVRLCVAFATILSVAGCQNAKIEPIDPGVPTFLSTECAADAVGNPPEFVWTYHSSGDYYSGVLEVSEATFTIRPASLAG